MRIIHKRKDGMSLNVDFSERMDIINAGGETMEEKKFGHGGARAGAGRLKGARHSIVFQVRCTDDEKEYMIKALNKYRLDNKLPTHKPRKKEE